MLGIISFSHRRSGQHGIFNWLCQQKTPSFYFSNCGYTEKLRFVVDGGVSHYSLNSTQVFFKEECGIMNLSGYNMIVFGFEDRKTNYIDYMKELADQNKIGNIVNDMTESIIVERSGKVSILEDSDGLDFDNIYRVFVVRDIYNLVASRLKCKERTDQDTVISWKAQIKLCMNNKSIIPIKFNDWFTDIKYRKYLSDKLQLNFTDSYLNRIGLGIRSSFDDRKYDYSAQNMRVLDRWKDYYTNKKFKDLIDEEAEELNKEFFGFNLDDLCR